VDIPASSHEFESAWRSGAVRFASSKAGDTIRPTAGTARGRYGVKRWHGGQEGALKQRVMCLSLSVAARGSSAPKDKRQDEGQNPVHLARASAPARAEAVVGRTTASSRSLETKNNLQRLDRALDVYLPNTH
jgi:hypothetical protein